MNEDFCDKHMAKSGVEEEMGGSGKLPRDYPR
jgi:hypothetical protein